MRVKGERREVMWSEYRSWKKWKRHEERADRCRSDSAESHGDLIMDREKSTSRRADPQPSWAPVQSCNLLQSSTWAAQSPKRVQFWSDLGLWAEPWAKHDVFIPPCWSCDNLKKDVTKAHKFSQRTTSSNQTSTILKVSLTVFPAFFWRFGFLGEPRVQPRCSFGVVTTRDGRSAKMKWMNKGSSSVKEENSRVKLRSWQKKELYNIKLS